MTLGGGGGIDHNTEVLRLFHQIKNPDTLDGSDPFRHPVNSPVEGKVVDPMIYNNLIRSMWLFGISEPEYH